MRSMMNDNFNSWRLASWAQLYVARGGASPSGQMGGQSRREMSRRKDRTRGEKRRAISFFPLPGLVTSYQPLSDVPFFCSTIFPSLGSPVLLSLFSCPFDRPILDLTWPSRVSPLVCLFPSSCHSPVYSSSEYYRPCLYFLTLPGIAS